MSKVYDCFTFFNELDLLEIRLNILDPYVDYFVIHEGIETFSGIEKPLYLKENWNRFKKWHHKIVHGKDKVKSNPNLNAFERAAEQKDSIREVLERLCRPDDIIFYGDVDEIWDPSLLTRFQYDPWNELAGKLHQINYSYYLNNRSSEEWYGTNVFKYKNIKNLNEIRADHSKYLENGGWHLSNQGGADQIRKKLEAYDHQEMNTDINKVLVEERMERGEDYAGRRFDWQGKPFEFWIEEENLPEYIKENKEKWIKLFR